MSEIEGEGEGERERERERERGAGLCRAGPRDYERGVGGSRDGGARAKSRSLSRQGYPGAGDKDILVY